MTSQSKTSSSRTTGRSSSVWSAKHRAGKFVQWNLGGQELLPLDVILADAEFVAVQEIARDEEGWDTLDGENFHWVTLRSADLYRGVGIGVAQDLLDCIIDKKACKRGIWVLARVKGLGRVVFGSIHCHTGVSQSVYLKAVREFFEALPQKWKLHPLVLGADVNEQLRWSVEQETGHIFHPSLNLSKFINSAHECGIQIVPPVDSDLREPTHFPRDITRRGRQIDSVWARGCALGRGEIKPHLRHCIGSDHAPVFFNLPLRHGKRKSWNNTSRARFVTQDVPSDEEIIDVEDVNRLASQYTRAKWNQKYKDSPEVAGLFQTAKNLRTAAAWKSAHKARKQNYRLWKQERLSSVLTGDWGAFRSYKAELRRRKGWWGRLLQDKSSEQLTLEVQDHLGRKLVDRDLISWDEKLQNQLSEIPDSTSWAPFSQFEMATQLAGMRAAAAVGPDLIGVDLLRHLAGHVKFGDQLLALINHIVKTNQRPEEWDVSFLALLAKIPCPKDASDLRPICVSSAFGKLVNRMVSDRLMPVLRRGSACSSCGKGRQVSDLLGAMSRLQEISKEWALPLLITKLDVQGAFDRLSRQRVVDLVLERVDLSSFGVEAKFLLSQLCTNKLSGEVPGGAEIQVYPNIGIKQGAPESAELFGIIMDAIIDEMRMSPEWGCLDQPLPDLDLDIMFYQDDIFIVEVCPKRLARRIELVEKYLANAGLSLAMSKPAVTATPAYRGALSFMVGETKVRIDKEAGVKVLGLTFNFSGNLSDQAHELLGRARSAAAEHASLLRARGSWKSKLFMIQVLVSSTFRWCAGAVHWNQECLAQANTLQLHVMRQAFRLGRRKDESWVDWNCRTLRQLRAFIHQESIERWSTCVLRLQFSLHGHWARRNEDLGRGVDDLHPNIAMRTVLWRNLRWWRQQQGLSDRTGVRHPRQFYPSNTERQIALSLGVDWMTLAQNREAWISSLGKYLHSWDVKWARGRQLSLRY